MIRLVKSLGTSWTARSAKLRNREGKKKIGYSPWPLPKLNAIHFEIGKNYLKSDGKREKETKRDADGRALLFVKQPSNWVL
jgi:hypothetical protein